MISTEQVEMMAVGVLDLMFPAALIGLTMWNMPPVRAGLICYGVFTAMITAS